MIPPLLLVMTLGCSRDGGDPGKTPAPPNQGTYSAEIFVADAAAGWCGAVRDCEPGTWQGVHGGDQSTCLSAERSRWQAELDQMDCEFDVDLAVMCVNSLATTTCEAWEAGTTQSRCTAVTHCP